MDHSWFTRCLALAVLVLVGQSATVFLPDGGTPEKKRFSVVQPSKLYLTGTTNVNTFKCDCEDSFVALPLEVENTDAVAKFRNTRLSMTTRKFNCRNAKMDRDMHKALQAETYPKIRIDLLETRHNPEQVKSAGTGWFAVDARVQLTITGVTKEKRIQAQARKLSATRFALKGEQSLKMTEFGIDPPVALFGLIKVDDLITFHFDLTIQVEDAVE